MNTLLKCLLILFCCCNNNPSSVVNTADDSPELSTKVVADNLNHPWEMLWGPDNMIWLTERTGAVKKVNPATGTVTTIFQVPDVRSMGEGGLLGMAINPDFHRNPFVYLAYDYNGTNGYKAKIVRYTYKANSFTSPIILLDGIEAAGIHNGCRLLIINDKLFITTGDASEPSRAQNTSLLNGKILRINLDGSIPEDNPISKSAIWSWGHRNPQGLVYANNILYSSEHGPESDDEINIIEKGRNYGWPDVRGFCNTSTQSFCEAHNIKEPIKAWTPTVAVCGLDFYGGNLIPAWKNSLLLTTLKGSKLIVMKLNAAYNQVTETHEYFPGTYGRLRDVCVSPAGKVYISSSNGGDADKIIEVTGK